MICRVLQGSGIWYVPMVAGMLVTWAIPWLVKQEMVTGTVHLCDQASLKRRAFIATISEICVT